MERGGERKILITGVVLFAFTLALLLFRIGFPTGPFFDEGAYVNLARSFLQGSMEPMSPDMTHITFGRQHPPMATYLIAMGMRLAGDGPLGWRLASALAGSFTLVAMFVWIWILLRDYELALTAAVLTLFNNFLFVMSRAAMLDGLMFGFAIWAVVAFTAAIQLETSVGRRRALVVMSGVLFGVAGATKWNAVDCWVVVCVACAGLLLSKNSGAGVNAREIGLPMLLIGLLVIPAVTYAAVFLPLFHEMQETFSLKTLVAMHRAMLTMTKAAPGNPTQSVAWYAWPLRTEPMRAFSYLVGNPVVMWGGLAAVVVCIVRFAKRASLAEGMVVALYAANLLQWAVTPLRIPNYYYYYSAAMFLGPVIAVALKETAPHRILKMRPALIVTVAAFVVFLYCYPRMAHLEAPWDCMFGCWN